LPRSREQLNLRFLGGPGRAPNHRSGIRGMLRVILLAVDHAQPAAPALRETYADHLKLRRKIAQQHFRGGMKTLQRRDQVDQRRRRLQLHAREISVTREIGLLEMTPNAKPLTGGLHRQMKVLRGFQL
jgi:hypothetical protein